MSKLIKFIKFIVLCSLLLAGPAFAAGNDLNPAGNSAWDLYVFGNGEAVAAILSSIGSMVSSPGYRHLLWFLATTAMFGWGIFIGMSSQNIVKFSPYFVTMIIVLYTLVGFPGVNNRGGVTANINVMDRNDPTGARLVNTSALVGVPAAIVSQIGNWLTTSVEQNFSTPNQLRMSGGSSFMMGQRLINDATQIHIMDPYLRQSISTYMQDCAIPMMANGDVNAAGLLKSNDLWGALASTNQGLMTINWPTPVANSKTGPNGGVVTTCAKAYASITAELAVYAPELIKAAAGAWQNTPAFEYTSAALDSAMSYFSNSNAGGGAAAIKQAAVINTVQGSYAQAAAMSNNSEMMTAVAASQAEKSQKSGWIMAANLFNNMMGYVYALLQAFIIGIGPIMAAAILIPGFGFAIVKNYLQILLWVVIWDPLLAIIQFIMAIYGQQDLSAVLSLTGGFSIYNLPAVTEKTNNMLIAGGFFATMVPLLAWGLVKGSMAFTEFISHGMGASLANSAGAAAASGNMNLDNVSMGNIAMHKTSFESAAGVGGRETTAYGSGLSRTESFNTGGSLASTPAGTITATATKTAGSSASLTTQQSDSLKATISQSESVAKSENASLITAAGNTFGTTKDGGNSYDAGNGKSFSKDMLKAAVHDTSQAMGIGNGTALSRSQSDQFIMSVGANLAGKIGLGGGNSPGASVGLSGDAKSSNYWVTGDEAKKSITANKTDTAKNTDTDSNKSTTGATAGDKVSYGEKNTEGLSVKNEKAYQEAVSHAQNYSKAVESSNSASRTLTGVVNQGYTMSYAMPDSTSATGAQAAERDVAAPAVASASAAGAALRSSAQQLAKVDSMVGSANIPSASAASNLNFEQAKGNTMASLNAQKGSVNSSYQAERSAAGAGIQAAQTQQAAQAQAVANTPVNRPPDSAEAAAVKRGVSEKANDVMDKLTGDKNLNSPSRRGLIEQANILNRDR